MTSRETTVECRIASDRKQQWKAYIADTSTVDTLSDLVRLAVEKERNDAYNQSTDAIDSTVINQFEDRLDRLSTQLAQIQTQLDSLESLHRETASSEDGNIAQLMREVVTHLIEVPDEKTFKELGRVEHTDPALTARTEGTPSHFADLLDVEPSRVRQALNQAENQYPDVHCIRGDDGTRRYYRRNPQADQSGSNDFPATNTVSVPTDHDRSFGGSNSDD